MDYNSVLVTDQRIQDITDNETYAVFSGPSSNNYQTASSNVNSNSMLSFNVQVPNQDVVIDRYIQLQTRVNITIPLVATAVGVGGDIINGVTLPENTKVFGYGDTDAFNSFPLSSCFSTIQSTINNANVSVNLSDVLPVIKKLNKHIDLTKYNSDTPTAPNSIYGRYRPSSTYPNSVLGSANNLDPSSEYQNRGSWSLDYINVVHNLTRAIVGPSTDSSLIVGAYTVGGNNKTAESWSISISATFTEPIFLSPFLYMDSPYNRQGLLGINTLSFTFNVDSTLSKIWSSSNNWITSITSGNLLNPGVLFSEPKLLFNYLTLQPSQMKLTKNILPYQNIERYITTTQTGINAAPALVNGTQYNLPSQTLPSSNIQLSSIPDLIIIYVPLPSNTELVAAQTSPSPSNLVDAFLPISNISVNFNNVSGLLSSANQTDLWKMTARHCDVNWSEFRGYFINGVGGDNLPTVEPSCGSFLVISPSTDLSLPESLSEGSIGQFNLQFNLTVANQYNVALTNLSIYTMCVSSGLFVTDNGVSNSFTSILTKEEVLRTKATKSVPELDKSQYERMVGGMSSRHIYGMKNIMKKVKGSKSSYGLSGGGESGGMMGAGESGGKLKKYVKKSLKYLS